MSHSQNLTTTLPLTTFTTLATNVLALALASNPTSTTTPDLFGNDPYFPANLDVTVPLTSSFPTSTSLSSPTSVSNGTALSFAPPEAPLRWFEQPWIPLAVWLLFAYSLASAVVLVWMWCVESWSLRSTVDASYEYRIRQSVEDARTVDEMLEEESWGHWRALTEQQQEDAVRRARDQRRYVEMSDAAARMGTF